MLLVTDRCFKTWQVRSIIGKLFVINQSYKRWQNGSRSGKNDVYCRLVKEVPLNCHLAKIQSVCLTWLTIANCLYGSGTNVCKGLKYL
jgi:hypothetical protein